MAEQFLSDTLTKFIERSGYSIGQVARLSGVPRRSLANWATGRAKRPRNVDDLLMIAATIRLTAAEVDELLLAAAMGTTLSHLLQTTTANDPLYPLLEPWGPSSQQHTPTQSEQSVPFQAIRELPYFVGREDDIRVLSDRLRQPRSNLVVIQGMGGVGKSSLAARLAYQLRDAFPDGVLWARVDQSNTMAILHSFAAAFGRDVSQYADPNTRSRVVREILADKRVLMVLDNAHDDNEIDLLLPPTTKRCGVIVTTRRIDLSSLLGAFWYRLAPFANDAGDALNLFAQILGEVRVLASRQTFEQLAALLGYLPLAIAIAAGRLATDTLTSAEDLLHQLRQQDTNLSQLSYGRDSVLRTFDLSFDWLSEDEQHFFTSLGVFSNHLIPIDAIAFVTQTSSFQASQLLQKLYQLSLVQSAEPGKFKLHPLIYDYANARRQEHSDGRARMVAYMVNYCETNRYDYPSLAAAFDQLLKALDYANADGLEDSFMQGAHALIPYLIATGQFTIAESYMVRVQQLALLSQDDENQTRALVSLGEIQLRRGEFELAGQSLSQARQLAESLPESEAHTNLYRCFGHQQLMVGEINSALDALKLGLDIARRLRLHDNATLILSRMAEIERTRGNFDLAEQHDSEGLMLARAQQSNRLISMLLNSSGITAIMRGNYEKGDACFRESLKIAREMGDREKCCGYLMNIGSLSTARGRLHEAHELLLEGLAIAREIGHRELQSILLTNTGVVCWRLGWLEKSAEYLEEAYAICTIMQNVKSKLVAMRRLGDLYISSGHLDKAASILTNGLEQTRKRGYAEEMTRFISSMSDLHLLRNELDQAEAFAVEGLNHAKEQGLPVEACLLIINRAQIAQQQGALDSAEALLKEAHDIATTIDDAALLCKLHLANGDLAMAGNEPQAAHAHYDAARTLAREQSLCEYHAYALFGLAQALAAQDEWSKSRIFGRKSLRLLEQSGFAASVRVATWLDDHSQAFLLQQNPKTSISNP